MRVVCELWKNVDGKCLIYFILNKMCYKVEFGKDVIDIKNEYLKFIVFWVNINGWEIVI